MAVPLASQGVSLLARGRRLLTNTPGRLRLQSIVVLLFAVAVGVATNLVVADRLGDADRIATEIEPAIVSARAIQTDLAEANAAAASAFVAGGVENAAQRARYEQSLSDAAANIETAARLVGDDDDESHLALTELTAALPTYSGLIETARTNNRQGFPVGSSYIDAASTLLETEVYPNTDLVANRTADRYRSSFDRLRGAALIVGWVMAGLVLGLVLLLGLVQFGLRRRFKRTFNPLLVLATVVAVALFGWLGLALSNSDSRLSGARDDGYERARLLLDIRANGFGAKADEARFLIARGAGDGFETSFGRRETRMDELLDAAEADQVRAAWQSYTTAHANVISADRSGDREAAVDGSLGSASDAFTGFDEASANTLARHQNQFESDMDDARSSLRLLGLGALLAALIAGGLAVYGLQLRINEYR